MGPTRDPFCLLQLGVEMIGPEPVRGEQSVGSRVPVRWIAQVRGMIEHSDPDRFTARVGADVVDPLSAFAPSDSVPVAATVQQRSFQFCSARLVTFRYPHRPRDAHEEAAVFHVTKRHRFRCRVKFDIVIHQYLPVFEWSKSDPHSFSHYQFFFIEPTTPGDELSGLARADGLDFFQFDTRGMLTFLSRPPIPKIDTVHVTVRKT